MSIRKANPRSCRRATTQTIEQIEAATTLGRTVS